MKKEKEIFHMASTEKRREQMISASLKAVEKLLIELDFIVFENDVINGDEELSIIAVLKKLDHESGICVMKLKETGNIELMGTIKEFIESVGKEK